jgi:ribulose 1,5-bisphosphate synthetase/thiazole synthase
MLMEDKANIGRLKAFLLKYYYADIMLMRYIELLLEKENNMESYDYIIIRAGIGGLNAVNFLAKHNKKVLVLEKHDCFPH